MVNWDADCFETNDEARLTMESANSDVVTPNIVGAFVVNDAQTELTFKLSEGLK